MASFCPPTRDPQDARSRDNRPLGIVTAKVKDTRGAASLFLSLSLSLSLSLVPLFLLLGSLPRTTDAGGCEGEGRTPSKKLVALPDKAPTETTEGKKVGRGW